MVKKEKFKAYLKSKGFYISLLSGLAAIAVICLVCYSYTQTGSDDNMPDLNEPIAQKDAQSNPAENFTQSASNSTQPPQTQPSAQPSGQTADGNREPANLLENDIYEEGGAAKDVTAIGDKEEQGKDKGKSKKKKKDIKKDESKTQTDTMPVMSTDGKSGTGLTFDEEKGLLWPVTGDIIMNYSMEKGIYFQTLGQYKCNPAIMIGCKKGTQVHSAAKAIVTEILENEETGLTVKTMIDDKYEVIYGQLKDIKVNQGDTVLEGEVIGTVAAPTKYYIKEGSNLYFQVLENGDSINPMLLLR